MEGNFPRFPINFCDNPSVIDYSLCHTDLLPEIRSFTVLPFTGLSDHCCISLNIKVKMEPPATNFICPNENKTIMQTYKHTYSYDKRKKRIYEQNLEKDKNVDALYTSLIQGEVNIETINKSVSDLNDILITAARKKFTLKKSLKNTKKNITGKKTKKAGSIKNVPRVARYLGSTAG